MSLTILKSQLSRLKPRKITYRSYKNFNVENFLEDLSEMFETYFPKSDYQNSDLTYNSFVNILVNTLNKHAPLKARIIRGNQASFMGRDLRKGIMTRSRLKSKYNQDPTPENRLKYTRQRNLCVSLRNKAIRYDFHKETSKGNLTSKSFYKLLKPYLTNKGSLVNNDLILIESDEMISESSEVAEIFNDYFVNIVRTSTGVNPNNIKDFLPKNVCNTEVVENIIQHYQDHPSILKIQECVKHTETFSLKHVTPGEVNDHLKKLNEMKSTGDDKIPVKILKISANILDKPLTKVINSSINNMAFPTEAKTAAVTPIFKSDDKNDKKNYRPVSILNSLSKILENVIKDQITPFFDNFLSTFISAYRKCYSSQHVLLRLIETWRDCLDQSELFGIILMDLSKAFDCIPHDLLIAKLNAYGVDDIALTYIYSYLKDRKQAVRINDTYSTYMNILSGVPQGSILGPILFNVFINDLFLFIKIANIHNYADDNAIQHQASTLEDLTNVLESESNIAVDWLSRNEMIVNPKKFQLLLSMKRNTEDFIGKPINVSGKTIFSTDSIKFLGINIDNKLKFNEHINSLCRHASQQLNSLYRLNKYLTFESKQVLVNSFIYSNFNYCPLVWHITSANSIKKIEKIQERSLRFLYNDFNTSYDQLLELAGKSTMLVSRVKTLCIEIYKTINCINPNYMQNIFMKSINRISPRYPNNLNVPQVNQSNYGTKSLRVLGPKIWNELPEEIKSAETLKMFKTNIKMWEGPTCNCSLCKFHTSQL